MPTFGVISPGKEAFAQEATRRRVIPVSVTVLADALTPVGVYERLAGSRPGTFLLESAAEGVWSRYSFIGAGSAATLTSDAEGGALWIGTPPHGVPTEGNPVEVLRDTLAYLALPTRGDGAPFTSGLVGFVGWEAVRHWERLPHPPHDDTGLPELAMNLVTDLAIHDNVAGTLTLVANAYNRDGRDTGVEAAYDDAVARLDRMIADLDSPAAAEAPAVLSGLDVERDAVFEAAEHRWAEEDYREAIARTKEAIVEGEVFQAVVARRFDLRSDAAPLDVYRVLRATNPSPYMYLYTFEHPGGGSYSVVGSSPEALVTLKGRDVVTHPIAGSRPRGAGYEEDQLLEKGLLADEKERSEHLMLVDLSRNDLSKVCVPGTVEVTQFMEVERFSQIMHLVSNVVGRLEEGVSAYELLAATFPAGTLSGAPKPRALRLLDELEPVRRGVYGGVVGYFDLAGDMDMAIAIRTAVLRDGVAHVQAGGGIVADSDPDAESEESKNKSFAPLRAVYVAGSLRRADASEGTA